MANIGINIGLTANAKAWDVDYDAVANDADETAQWDARVAHLAQLIASSLPPRRTPAGYRAVARPAGESLTAAQSKRYERTLTDRCDPTRPWMPLAQAQFSGRETTTLRGIGGAP